LLEPNKAKVRTSGRPKGALGQKQLRAIAQNTLSSTLTSNFNAPDNVLRLPTYIPPTPSAVLAFIESSSRIPSTHEDYYLYSLAVANSALRNGGNTRTTYSTAHETSFADSHQALLSSQFDFVPPPSGQLQILSPLWQPHPTPLTSLPSSSQRNCKSCGIPGHNSRTCKKK
jgi:hypothetical protein